MDLQLKGKRAFVSGSSSGLGAAMAVELAREGVAVAVHGRDRARVDEMAALVSAEGVEALATVGDLSRDTEANEIGDAVLTAFGGVDILINNAGAVLRKDNPQWSELASQEWVNSFQLNVMSAVRMSNRFTPGMAERGWGRVINISSMAASQRNGRTVEYGAAKAGLENFTVNLSKVLGPQGVTVNAISPGVIMTPAVETWLKTMQRQNGWPDDPDYVERAYAQDFMKIPLGRLGKPREIATIAAMLASPLSGFVNGVILPVDGGTRN